jgi:hypothetical protein
MRVGNHAEALDKGFAETSLEEADAVALVDADAKRKTS